MEPVNRCADYPAFTVVLFGGDSSAEGMKVSYVNLAKRALLVFLKSWLSFKLCCILSSLMVKHFSLPLDFVFSPSMNSKSIDSAVISSPMIKFSSVLERKFSAVIVKDKVDR